MLNLIDRASHLPFPKPCELLWYMLEDNISCQLLDNTVMLWWNLNMRDVARLTHWSPVKIVGILHVSIIHYLNQWWHSLLTHICVVWPRWINVICTHSVRVISLIWMKRLSYIISTMAADVLATERGRTTVMVLAYFMCNTRRFSVCRGLHQSIQSKGLNQ